MKYVIYELRKVFGIKYLTVILVLLLILNGMICLYQNTPDSTSLPVYAIEDIFEKYTADPEQIKNEYIYIKEWVDDQDALFREQMRLGNYDYEIEILANKYAPVGYTDEQLLNEIFFRYDYIKKFPSEIQRLIDASLANLEEFSNMATNDDSYVVKYQNQITQIYSTIQSQVQLGLEYTRGWDAFYTYEAGDILIFLLVIAYGTAIFTEEKNSGFIGIIRTAKNGRSKTALAKIVSMLILTTGITILLVFESFIIIGCITGYSSPYNALQVFEAFQYCPYIITVGEYFVIFLGIKLLTFYMFAAVVMAVSVFLYNYAATFLISILIIAINLVLHSFNIGETLLGLFNIISSAAVFPFFERYRAVNFFENVSANITIVLVLLVAIFFICCLCTLVVYNGNLVTAIRFKNKQSKSNKNIIFNFHNINRRYYSLSIYLTEIYKMLISSRLIYIVGLLLIVKIFLSNEMYDFNRSYFDTVYKEYMTILAGEMTEEKQYYLTQERQMINDTLTKKNDMQQRYAEGKITIDEYKSYISDYNYAYSRDECLQSIEDHAEYIIQLKNEGKDAWFLYDTGWKKLFFAEHDWILYGLCIILFSGVFVREYAGTISSGGFDKILRTTKNGRQRTFVTKYLSSCCIATGITVICNITDLYFIINRYDLPFVRAPIHSIEAFADLAINISIIEYAVIYYLCKIVAAILLALLLCALSGIMKKSIPVVTTTLIITGFPFVMTEFGVNIFDSIDYTLLARATPLLIKNEGGLIYIFISLMICTTLIFCSTKKWVNNR